MSKKIRHLPGIAFKVGARVEAQDCLQKWYPSRIEKIDYNEGKMLVHFDRWSHRYDEWIHWDSNRLRPLKRPILRKRGLKDEEETAVDFKSGEEVLARWTDCRYYPAKVETLNKEGTYTVQFYDGVIRCVKKMHIKSMPEDAKGQDWIALVKAAAAATTKNKIQCKPRSSTYSSKDKEEKKGLKVTPKKEAEESTSEAPSPKVQTSEEKSVSPESLVKADILKAEPKSASVVMETAASKKKNSQCSSFQAKRARLNKITGFLASKAVVADSSEKKKGESKVFPLNEQKLPKTECQKQSVNLLSSPQCERTNSAITFSSGRSRSRKSKAEPYNSFGSKLKPKSFTTIAFSQEDEIKLEPQIPLSETASSGQSQGEKHHRMLKPNHRHRRYQRSLAVLFEPPLEQVLTSTSSPTGKRLSSNSHTKQEPGFLEVETAATSLSSQKCDMVLPLDLSKHSKVVMAASPVTPVSKQEVEGQNETKIVHPPSSLTERKTVVSSAAGAVIRVAPTTVKPNRPREPVINTKKTEDFTFTKETVIDLDHNKFKCKVPGCLKAFRKAKLLDYHLKYYHSTNKETELETGSAGSAVQSHATSITVPTSTPETQDSKRLRTVSGSSSLSSDSHTIQVEIPLTSNLKLFKSSKKKRSSTSLSSDGNDAELSVFVKQTSFESLHEKILKKVTEKNRDMETCVLKSEKKIKLEEKCPSSGKKKEKDKERKEKKDEAHFKVKQKKKKKKKKKSKQHDYLKYDENSLDFLDKCSHPQSLGNSVVHRNIFQMKNSSCQYPRAILSVDLTGENLSDVEFLDDSSTESLLLSGDEYNQDFDSANLEDSQGEENTTHEIVRCVCDMDEENGFMIQCEECLCWQHSTCMGLLEETIPERYVCYICRDPTGQRWSAKYRFDKDWLNKGHLYGLSFLNENYSHQNAKKIIATHHLLADVYSAAEILHSLKLKIGILQSKQHSDLHFWACSGLQTEEASVRLGIGKGLLTFQEKVNCPEYNDSYKVQFNPVLKAENNYITSEHSYQKPHVYTQDHRPFIDPASSDDEDDSSSLDDEHGIYFHASKRQQELHSVKQRHLTEQDAAKGLPLTSDNNYERIQVEKQGDSYLQWQLNLLTHIENVQNEVTTRIELIEKEVDVLESWLDFTGELEPPEPLARLPQLKRRIKQLLADLGKVQQMATLCPV